MNYAKYNDEEILDCYYAVDRLKYPGNFNLILAEMEKRGLFSRDAKATAVDAIESQHQRVKPSESPSSVSAATRPAAKTTPAHFTLEDVYTSVQADDKKSFNPWYLLVISAILFVLAGIFAFDTRYLILIMPVILIHELGHLLAMKLFRYRNTKILFVPMLGGLATGTPKEYSQTRESIVFLFGPLVGTVSGFLFTVAYSMTGSQILFELALLAFLINGLNLLPVPPLDGGRIVESLFTSRSIYLEMAFSVIAVAVLGYAAFYFKDWIMALLAYIMFISIKSGYNDYRVLKKLEEMGGLGGNSLDPPNVERILRAMNAVKIESTVFARLGITAQKVRNLFNKTQRKNAPWLPTVGIFVGYLIVCLFTFIFAVAAFKTKKDLGI